MKILVATEQTQGDQPDDFNYLVPGELVYAPMLECGRPEECGCGRAWAGIASTAAGTTAVVVDADMSVEDYVAGFVDGFANAWGHDLTDPEARAVIEEYALEHLDIAGGWDAGDVVGRDGEHINQR